jgi:hypothetical protein
MLADRAFMELVNNKSHSHATIKVYQRRSTEESTQLGNSMNIGPEMNVYYECILYI